MSAPKIGRAIFVAVVAALVVPGIGIIAGQLFPPPDVSGRWNCLTQTTNSGRYKGMLRIYPTTITQQQDGALTGRDEKSHDSSTDTAWIPTPFRSRGSLDGTVWRKYIGTSEVSLGIDERTHNGIRSQRTYAMRITGERMVGTFTSTVDNQTGQVLCQRDEFDTAGERNEVIERLRALTAEHRYSVR